MLVDGINMFQTNEELRKLISCRNINKLHQFGVHFALPPSSTSSTKCFTTSKCNVPATWPFRPSAERASHHIGFSNLRHTPGARKEFKFLVQHQYLPPKIQDDPSIESFWPKQLATNDCTSNRDNLLFVKAEFMKFSNRQLV